MLATSVTIKHQKNIDSQFIRSSIGNKIFFYDVQLPLSRNTSDLLLVMDEGEVLGTIS